MKRWIDYRFLFFLIVGALLVMGMVFLSQTGRTDGHQLNYGLLRAGSMFVLAIMATLGYLRGRREA